MDVLLFDRVRCLALAYQHPRPAISASFDDDQVDFTREARSIKAIRGIVEKLGRGVVAAEKLQKR